MTLRARCCDLEAYTELQRHMDHCRECRNADGYCREGLRLVNAYHRAAQELIASTAPTG
jgi:CO dehydrogenase/acetyl-CoA synthase alpha subunit